MQVVKLVNGGFVDRLIAFDELPDWLIKGIGTRDLAGLPRYWAKWFSDHGSVRDVIRCIETTKDASQNYFYKYQTIGREPCFFVLDYKDTNRDKEKWAEICNYLRRNVEATTRLLDSVEAMAIPMAPDSYVSLTIEPEDIPVIPIPKGAVKPEDDLIKPDETILLPVEEMTEQTVTEPARKKRGRPRKNVEATV